MTDAVLKALDETSSHQGPAKVLERISKEKYVFHNEHAEELDPVKIVEDHCEKCSQCKEVEAIKELLPKSDPGGLLQIPEEHLQRVLEFGDLKHQGFAECSKRLTAWCTFPDFHLTVKKAICVCRQDNNFFVSRFKHIAQNVKGVQVDQSISSWTLRNGKPSVEGTNSSSYRDTMALEK